MPQGGSWDITKAVVAAWNGSTLDATFKALWSDPDTTDYLVLNDTEARPGTPFPYCVFTQSPGLFTLRSSHESDATKTRVMDSQVFEFYVYSDSKTQAATLAAEVAEVFKSGTVLTVEGGSCHVHFKRGQDSPQRNAEGVWMWTISVEAWYEYEE